MTPPNRTSGIWIPALFLLLGLLSGLWVLAARSLFPGAPNFPNTASTTLLFLVAVALSRRAASSRYQWSIAIGLGCSSLGDAFLMHPGDYFLPGLGSFLAAHVCYLWALTSDQQVAEYKQPFAIWAVIGLVLLGWLWPGVPGALRVPVVLYTLALLGMAAQAASRALGRRDFAASVAAIGAVLFVVSDSVLAFQRFRHPLEWGRMTVLGTYFLAQGCIASSVILGKMAKASSVDTQPEAVSTAPDS